MPFGSPFCIIGVCCDVFNAFLFLVCFSSSESLELSELLLSFLGFPANFLVADCGFVFGVETFFDFSSSELSLLELSEELSAFFLLK